MGEQRNLTEENVEELKAKLEFIQEKNPDLEYRFFKQVENEQPFNKELLEKVESLEKQLAALTSK